MLRFEVTLTRGDAVRAGSQDALDEIVAQKFRAVGAPEVLPADTILIQYERPSTREFVLILELPDAET